MCIFEGYLRKYVRRGVDIDALRLEALMDEGLIRVAWIANATRANCFVSSAMGSGLCAMIWIGVVDAG